MTARCRRARRFHHDIERTRTNHGSSGHRAGLGARDGADVVRSAILQIQQINLHIRGAGIIPGAAEPMRLRQDGRALLAGWSVYKTSDGSKVSELNHRADEILIDSLFASDGSPLVFTDIASTTYVKRYSMAGEVLQWGDAIQLAKWLRGTGPFRMNRDSEMPLSGIVSDSGDLLLTWDPYSMKLIDCSARKNRFVKRATPGPSEGLMHPIRGGRFCPAGRTSWLGVPAAFVSGT
jgi:hypothetical protein